MKGIYWRPQKVSRVAIVLIAGVSLLGLAAVEELLIEERSALYEVKLQAARLAQTAQRAVRDERVSRGYPIDDELDPAGSGLIGAPSSPMTSSSGSLYSKQLTTNPNLAALVVQLLDDAGVEPGDVVAVGMSGSFPGLNIAILSAASALEVDPVVITSASSSEWGGNIIGFGWPDMEAHLAKAGIFPFRSVAGSLGGVDDRALGMSRAGQSMLRGMLERNGIPLIETETLGDSVDERLRLYQEHADGQPIRAYINVGGGMASIGGSEARDLFRPGVNRPSGFAPADLESVMQRFLQRGVPVIHLSQLRTLAQRHGLAHPEAGAEPEIGAGPIFVAVRYNPWLALGVLLFLVVALYAVTRSDLGARLLATEKPTASDRPRPMV